MSLLTFTAKRRLAVLAATALLVVGLCESGSGSDGAGAAAGVVSGRDAMARLTQIGDPHPETYHDLAEANAQMDARAAAPYGVRDGAYASAVAERGAMRAATAAVVPGGDRSWIPLGLSPFVGNPTGFSRTENGGVPNLSGRVQSFATDPANPAHWYTASSNGGVWETTNGGADWHSVSETLPTQLVGAIAFLPSTHTLIAGTGDPGFGGTSIVGLGVLTSTNNGASWQKASGIPDGTMTFRIALDPSNDQRVYAATGKGLWRSTDGGRTFTNVALPTTCTDINDLKCYLANIVTDVVVRTPDSNGAGGGKVLAAVGWRAGPKADPNGTVQSPRNGIYVSNDGTPGSFNYLGAPPGFTPQNLIGRTALGIAHGAQQNHDTVFAVVEDAARFNGGATVLDAPEPPGGGVPNNTVLNGIYASTDFGANWVKLSDAQALQVPGNNSSLTASSQIATYAPGVQAWYNEWIEPDPTRQDSNGLPTRLVFGLEEVWSNATPVNYQVDNGTVMKVIGRYFGGSSCFGLVLGFPLCPTSQPVTPSTTTHPDQHAGTFVPDASGGGVTLLAGNDGGVYAQHVASGEDFANDKWGDGANTNLHTLQPYDAEMSKDGTVYAGLQDNGVLKIQPDGKQLMIKDGDGFFSPVDPDHSATVYGEATNGTIQVSIDGGQNWRSIPPASLTSPLFSTPIVMDPTDANHVLIGAREVNETVDGPKTQTGGDPILGTGDTTDWAAVFDLGTRLHRGDATATADTANGDPNNSVSAADVRAENVYVGFCGFCDLVTQGQPFGNGIATNVGGDKPAKKKSGDGWHVAAAAGLPERYITSVKMDPADPKTVYVTLGGYGRRWVPPGALGDDTSQVGTGHVFVSHDAGATFSDISGNLPDVPANWSVLHDGHLVVATDLGVFVSTGAASASAASSSVRAAAIPSYAVLGTSLPNVPVFHLQVAPQDPNLLVAATFGRGVYTYSFAPPPAAPATPAAAPAAAPAPKLPATGGRPWLALLGLAALIAALGSGRLRRVSRRG